MSTKETKGILKKAKACLESKDYEGAANNFRSILTFEPNNFTAHLYLGRALFNLGSYQGSEESIKNALAVDPKYEKQPTPWQGLLKIYDQQQDVPKYLETAEKLSILFQEGSDRARCAEVVNNMILFVQKHGTTEQHKQVLNFILPDSPVFDFLEGLIPHPADTYSKLAGIVEKEEKDKINKEIANRRSRLTATKGNVILEVHNEVLGASPLEDLYQKILNWSDSEELRRETEKKLIQHGYEKLLAFPPEKKTEQRKKVAKWAEGMVILKYPFELAWRITIEWKDCESLVDHDVNILREYIGFFPETGLGNVLKAYLDSEISPFPPPAPTEDEETAATAMNGVSAEKILAAMSGGLANDAKSILCHRIYGEYCLYLNEYETAVETCREGRKLCSSESRDIGISLQKNIDAITATLATSLIHYQSPKYHEEAKRLFEGILKRNDRNNTALVGLGLILEEQLDYDGALKFLTKALELDRDSTRILSEASWCRVLMGQYVEGREGLEECLKAVTGVDAQSRELKAQILWRIGTCIWNADEESRSDRRGAYAYFMQALQSNGNYAPAYTSMGIYYADIANDIARATKCFEKAFEISAGEVEAAERLARMFADTQAWDLVEIIARRVADADKKRAIPGKAMNWPQNAIGCVELNAQNYTKAIISFQAAIRSSPTDFHSWVGLGEAYANSGRYIAALKSFREAARLDDQNWFVKYMIANVHRELGEFNEACTGYRYVLFERPDEFGVLMALGESLLATANSYVVKGYFGQATVAVLESLDILSKVAKINSDTFNVWKSIGDACLLFSWIQSFAIEFPLKLVKDTIFADIEKTELDIISEYDGVGSNIVHSLTEETSLKASIYLGLLAFKRAICVSADDRPAHAVAWYNLGCAEYRAYSCSIGHKEAHHRSAIRCFKRAIKVEPGNHDFWNALGVVTSEISARTSQHAFVRSLYINEKDPRVWTNLGALYLVNNDGGLASQAFTRAQSADPDYAYAWVGQGLVSILAGEFEVAQELFEHAFEISDGFATLAKHEFATSTFDTAISVQPETSFTSLIGPIFALHKLKQQLSDQPTLLHLGALLQERIGEFDKASKNLYVVCDTFEAQYQETEKEEDLIRYAQSKADLARLQLGLREYDEAIEHASMALDLSTDIEQLRFSRLSAHLTSGLAHYFSGNMNESLEMFKVALEESAENPDVVVLLAQVLWAKGGEEEKEVAREQLFACIENHPDHLPSMLLLGSIGVLDDNEDILEAVMGDLYSVRGRKLDMGLKDKVDNLLTVVSQFRKKDPIPIAASGVFLRPAHPGPWMNLAKTANSKYAADMARKVAARGQFSSEVVADALAGIGKIALDQRAIVIAPWRESGWEGLAADIAAAQ
ncbi:hypothetical protein BDZ91DRAFT_730696 [Kalaharituber pfeilii]|nr:hypothetical protein BDZ91DRAFT_730696 [Kalaharituber pfeilii]